LIRVLLAHSEPTIREGLAMRLALEPDLAVVGAVSDADDSLTAVLDVDPDVVLIDVKLAGVASMSTVQAIQVLAPEAGIVVLAVCGDPETRSQARAAGAVAVVENCAGDAALLQAIREAGS
jgi:two-component system nitrate/nitrite response regulator NarL